MPTCDVFNGLFPLDAQNKIQLLSGVLLFMASLFIGFLVEKYVTCQSLAMPTRASIVLNTERVQFVLQNCEILYSVPDLYDKNSAS